MDWNREVVEQCPWCDFPTKVKVFGGGECIHCGNEYRWYPSPKDMQKNPGLAYHSFRDLIWSLDLRKEEIFSGF